MFKTFDIKLDVEKDLYSPMQILFNVSNSDDSVELSFEITQDETPFDLTGKTIQIAVQDPSKIVVYQDIQIDEPILGKASVKLSQDAYDGVGLHVAEIYIRDVDNTIVTSPFYFLSRDSIVHTEEIPTGTEIVSWESILNKPSFFPPDTHDHEIADVNGLQTALDGKANVGDVGGGVPADHTHLIADVTGLQTALDGKVDDAEMTGKANTIHNHAIADVTGLQTALDSKLEGIHSHAIGDITGLQNALDSKVDDAQMGTKADLEHQHGILDITGLQPALDGKMDDGDAYLKTETYNKTELYNKLEIDQLTFSEGGGSPVIVEDNLMSVSNTNALSSNQGRILNETKASVDHDHVIADVTDLQIALDGKANAVHNHDALYSSINHNHDATYSSINHNHDLQYAPIDHIHDVLDVSGLQDVLNSKADDLDLVGKSDVGHTHVVADVTGLQTALDGKADDIHNHAIADVTGLQTALDGKSDVNHNHDLVYAPIDHDHAIVDVTGLQTALDGKADDVHSHTSAEISDFGTAVAGAIPTEYLTQTEGDALYQPIGAGGDIAIANVTGLQSALDGKVDDAEMTGKADVVHTHTIANVTGLQTALDGKTTTTYADAGDNYIMNTRMAGLTLWKGTQAEYDAIGTPSSTTLYFIVG